MAVSRHPNAPPDVDDVEGPANDRAPRWCIPITNLIGEAEPDPDDSGDWIVRDTIPRAESSLFVGPYKGGKSYAQADLALCIALGKSWLSGAAENTLGRPGRVLVLALEDSIRRLRSRLWRLAAGHGTTPNDPLIRSNLCMSRAPVRIPDRADLKAFRAELAVFKPDAVLIDCLARVMIGDESDAAAAKEYTAAITAICVDLGIAVQVLHHTRKLNGETRGRFQRLTLDDVRGSGDLVASARHVVLWQALPVPDRKVARLYATGNLDVQTEERAVELVSDDHDGRTRDRMVNAGEVDALLAETRAAKKSEKEAQASAELRQRERTALKIAADRGEVTAATLSAVLSVAERTASRIIISLVASGHLERVRPTGPATVTPAGWTRLKEPS